jgi:hypothetical protein
MAIYTLFQVSTLAKIIKEHFTLATLRAAVIRGFGVSLDVYSVEATLPRIIITLCRKVNEENRIADLVVGLKSVNPNPALHTSLDAFVAGPVAAGNTFEVLMVSELPIVPVVNRNTLRGHIATLLAPGSSYRAISVDGPLACGKSHSAKLLRFVAKRLGARPITITVADEARTLSIVEAFHAIALGLNYKLEDINALLVDKPSDAQAAARFVSWLSGVSSAFVPTGEQVWIILDGLNRPTAAAFRDLLVPGLLLAAATDNLQHVTLFLLGDNGKRVTDARDIVLHESALTLTRDELATFLESVAEARGIKLQPAEAEALTQYVVGTTTPPYDHPAMDAIVERLTKAVPILRTTGVPIAQLIQELQ